MTTAPTAGLNLRANGGHHPTEHLSVRILMREAAKVCTDLGLNIGGGRLHHVIDRYVTEGRTGDAPDFRTWFISYADPTGERAVSNVMRARAG